MVVSRKGLILLAAFVAALLLLPSGGLVSTAFAQAIQVIAANPPSGEQGTLNLDVLINGNGFKEGANAKFVRTRTKDPGGVTVKSTRFVSSTQLIANIDIAELAVISAFDIQVQNADGRTGKGTELFSVVAKRVAQAVELTADFRDDAGDKIHSNLADPFISNQGTYPNDVVLTANGGGLYMRIQRNQRVFFRFDDAIRPWANSDGKVNCREYSPDGTGTPFTYAPPAFLLGDGQPNNDFATFGTSGRYSLENGQWTYDSSPFALTSLDVGGTAYVGFTVSFDIVEQNERFGVSFGYRLWEQPAPVAYQTGWSMIVQLTRISDIGWYIETLPPDHPIAVSRGLQAGQANLYLTAPSVRRVHGGGYCDLGEWRLPFALTLTRR